MRMQGGVALTRCLKVRCQRGVSDLYLCYHDRSGTIGDESIQGYVDRRCIEEGDVRRTRCPDQLLGISDE